MKNKVNVYSEIREQMYNLVDSYEFENNETYILNRQLRALFTTLCLVYDIQADTLQSDTVIRYTYNTMKWHNNDVMDFEDFYNFMVGDIV